MNHPASSRLPLASSCAALALVLAGCASPAPQAQPPTSATTDKPVAKKTDDKDVITGSRIPSKTTDRLLKTIDAAGAQEANRERGPEAMPVFR